MTKLNENLILEILKKIQNEQINMRDSLSGLNSRMGNVEAELANLHGMLAEQSIHMDKCCERVGRIERRLEIVS